MFRNLSKFGFSFAIVLCALTAFAQNGTVRGFIYEEGTGEPVIFTNVVLQGTTKGASTDVNGYFSITQVTPGTYNVEVSYLGFKTYNQEITVFANKIESLKIFLKKGAIDIKTVEISAEKQEAQTNVTMSVIKATPKDIKLIPTVGGSADLAQYLQVLPGVIFTGDQGGQLYIRGGSPVQNMVLLDGMIIYNPFHSIGLFSVFDTEIIKNADIYTGGFGAQFGGRISSVMDISTRDGNKRRTSGKFGMTTFGANVLLEGPLIPQTNEGRGSVSYILSAKHSYLDQSSKIFYSFIEEDGLPFRFTDLYGKVTLSATNGSKFNLFGFNFRDAARFQENSELNWDSYGGGINFVLVPDGSPVLIEGVFSVSDYKIRLVEQANAVELNDGSGNTSVLLPPRTSGINSFNLGINFKYFEGDNELKYGIEITGFGTNFSFFSPLGQELTQEANNTELAGFFNYKRKFDKLIVDLGFRAQYFASLRVFRPEPRVGVKYNVNNKFRVKAAGGLYSQNLISASSDRDVVNLFYGFLVGPEDLQNEFVNEDGSVREVLNPLQTSWHTIVGFEYDLTDRINLNVEGYFKNFTQLTDINRNKIYATGTPGVPDILKNDYIVESGTAKGIDVTFKYDDKKFYFWVVYSLAKVDRWDGVTSYNPVFDRRHNLNLVGAYKFGTAQRWELNARWNYGSGFPFTQNQGFYLRETFQGGMNSNVTQTNSSAVEILLGPLNQGRLPDYHRFDINLKRMFFFSELSSLEVNAGITNLYNRDNIFYIDRISGNRVNQLPILPSVGLLYSF